MILFSLRHRPLALSVMSVLIGTAKHFHAHLDVMVNGQNVPVPANLGVAATGNAMAELHTHDATRMLHIEAPTSNKRYTLGHPPVSSAARGEQTPAHGGQSGRRPPR
jgi:hypothetical protein